MNGDQWLDEQEAREHGVRAGFKQGFQAGYTTGYAKGKAEARPTGHWINQQEEGYVECPFCHKLTNCEGNIEELHFCFSCGAELGTKGKESE